jgi:hypothetical protein
MFSNFSLSRLYVSMTSRAALDDADCIAQITARKCLEKLTKSERKLMSFGWSMAQIRGYLRAVAAPWIDASLHEITVERPRTQKIFSLLKKHILDTMERLVLQELDQRAQSMTSKSVAA